MKGFESKQGATEWEEDARKTDVCAAKRECSASVQVWTDSLHDLVDFSRYERIIFNV